MIGTKVKNPAKTNTNSTYGCEVVLFGKVDLR